MKQETVSGSGISWAVCKSAPCSRQTTTPAPHHSVFTGTCPPQKDLEWTRNHYTVQPVAIKLSYPINTVLCNLYCPMHYFLPMPECHSSLPRVSVSTDTLCILRNVTELNFLSFVFTVCRVNRLLICCMPVAFGISTPLTFRPTTTPV